MSSNNPRGRQAADISAAFTGVSGVVVVLRLYTRFFLIRYAGIEDYLVALAMVSSVGMTVCIALQTQWGMGLHVTELDPTKTEKMLQAFWVSIILYALALGLTKISILLQYQRVFTTRWFQIACRANLAFAGGFMIFGILSAVLSCVPVEAFWTQQPGARCLDKKAVWFTSASLNVVQDLVMIVMPISVIRNLTLSRRQKVALIGVFAVGGFVCIVSIIRLQSLVAISTSKDPTYDNAPAAIWSAIETNVSIICSCLPLMRPLFTRWTPGFFSSHKRSGVPGPRAYSTIGTVRARRGNTSPNEYALHSTCRSHHSDDDIREIIVRTDIRVQVEDDKSNATPSRTDSSLKEWTEVTSNRVTERTHSSTDSLVKGPSAV